MQNIQFQFRPFTAAMMCAALIGLSMPADAGSGEKGEGKRAQHMQKMIEKFDKNGDGAVSKDEFMTQMEQRFSEMDKDSTGDITQDEFKAHHDEKRAKMKEKISKMKEQQDALPPSIESDIGTQEGVEKAE